MPAASKTILDLLKRKRDLEHEAEQIADRLREAHTSIAQLDNVIHLMGGEDTEQAQGRQLVMTDSDGDVRRNWSRELRGRSHIEALQYIARSDPNHEVTIPTAREILLTTGLSHGNTRYLSSQLHRLLKKSKHFEHVGPGRFKLISPTSTDPDRFVLHPVPDHYRRGACVGGIDQEQEVLTN